MSDLRIDGQGSSGAQQRVSSNPDPNPTTTNAEAPPAPKPKHFVSQKVVLNTEANLFMLSFRDPSSGEVTIEIPSSKAAAVYKKASGDESKPKAPPSHEPEVATSAGGDTSSSAPASPIAEGVTDS